MTRASGGPRERLVEPVTEERAVGEVGQPVVERLPGELLLEPDPLGHVARVQHDAADLPVVAEIGDVGLEVAPLFEPVRHPEEDSRGCAVREGGLDRGAVVRVDEALEARRRACPPRERRASRSTDSLT